MIRKFICIPNLLFLMLAALVLAPAPALGAKELPPPHAFLFVIVLIEGSYLYVWLKKARRPAGDIATAVFAFFIVWELATKYGLAHPVLVPSMESIFHVFVVDYQTMLSGLWSSLKLLGYGMSLALALGIGLGLPVGWVPRLRGGMFPIAKVLSTIPPLVYIPYVVAVMPTFKAASVFVVFSGVFWPTFMYVINYIAGIDKKILDSARTLNVSTPTMLIKIILPYIFPGIVRNLALSLTSAFMCLTGAEMIGAGAGLGFYVQKAASFINYPKVLAGIIFIGVVVTALNRVVVFIERRFVKW